MAHVLPATRRRRLVTPTALLIALVLVAGLAPAAGSQIARGADGQVDPAAAHAARVAGLDRAAQQGGAMAASAADRAVDMLDVAGAIPGELIVTTRDAEGLQRLQQTGWQALAGTPLRAARGLADRVALIRTDAGAAGAAARALLADPAVAAVEPNVRRAFMAVPDDTSYPRQWAHRQTSAEQAWDTVTGQGTTPPLIAILDSGVDATHPDLAPVVVQSLRSVNGQVIQGAPDNDPCNIGHGTAVAGSAAARGNDGFGVTGVLWQARVIDIALTSPENGCPGGPADSDTITAMAHVADLAERPHALNLSLGAVASACPTSYQAAVDQARAAGIAVVAAAGNFEQSAPGSNQIPGSCAGVISVAATDVDGQRASYSQRNPQVDIAAPGGDFAGAACPTTFDELVSQFVITTARNPGNPSLGSVCGDYQDPNGQDLQGISGTSFSAPYITGAVGLLRQFAADRGTPLSVDQVEAVIEGTARDAGDPGRDCDFGHGILDLAAAVAAVQSGAIPPLQPDAPIGTGSCTGGGGDGEQLPPNVIRVSDGASVTDPVGQAVAVSSGLLAGSAPWAVLARVDDFADALAGSAVGLGIGPLLFTPSTGGLDGRTEAELRRVVQPGGRVFIMGGTAAVPTAVDERLQQLGLTPVRIAGGGREATAVAASQVVGELTAQASFTTRDYAFVASGRAFADAVAAGQMAAYYGIPILVTNPDGPLHADTRAELQRLQPSQVYVVGGAAAISDPVLADIQALGFPTARLAGPTRVDTGLAVANAYVGELAQDGDGSLEAARTVGVNVRNNFNDVLSATLIGGLGNVFMPLEEDATGSVITDSVRQSGFCGFRGDLFVIGGQDRVSTASAVEANDILQGVGC